MTLKGAGILIGVIVLTLLFLIMTFTAHTLDKELNVCIQKNDRLVELAKEANADTRRVATINAQLMGRIEAFEKANEIAEIKTFEATAYTHTGNPTKTGVMPSVGMIAVDPDVIPLGTKVYVEGYGYAIATDTGGLINGDIIDLFMDTKDECIQWGRREVSVVIYK